MDVIHRFFENSNEAFRAFLDRCAIPYKYEENILGNFVTLEIAESDPQWQIVREAYQGFGAVDSRRLEFTSGEIRNAEWVELGVTSHFGYPQPEDDFGYHSVTYRPGSACEHCKIGTEQVAPFRFRKPPTQKRSHLLQLNWVFDEFFVRDEVRHTLEATGITGIQFSAPVLHRTGEVIAGWYQMHIPAALSPLLLTEGLRTETCGSCGKHKFNHPLAEMLRFRQGALNGFPDVFKTWEWFGSGGRAFRVVLVSKRFVDVILRNKWRGIFLQPVSLVDHE